MFPESLLVGVAPCGCAVPFQCGIESVPAITIGHYYNSEVVGFHMARLYSVWHGWLNAYLKKYDNLYGD